MVVCNSDEETWDVILNRANDYYKDDRERLWKKERDKYRKFSKEEKKWKMKIWKK